MLPLVKNQTIYELMHALFYIASIIWAFCYGFLIELILLSWGQVVGGYPTYDSGCKAIKEDKVLPPTTTKHHVKSIMALRSSD